MADNVSSNSTRPLCVDLDGTLIAGDTLWESIALMLRRQPALLACLPFWILGGPVNVKRQTARRAIPDPATLPYRQEVLAFLSEQAAGGRRILLTTGSDELLARPIAEHLNLFTDVVASDGITNRTGERKLAGIRDRLGPDAKFDYLGDGAADLPVFRAAEQTLLVPNEPGLQRRLQEINPPIRTFGAGQNRLVDFVRLLRPNQWAKNLLLIVPMLVGHYLEPKELATNLWHFLIAFITFSLSASSVYIYNDVLDAAADRLHPRKSRRPIAAGRVAMPNAILLANALATVAVIAALWQLGPAFALMLLLYILLSASYSLVFKRILLLDVFVLAALYTHRILAGGVALHVEISPWLLAFSMFFFLSLAFAKRYSELTLMRAANEPGAHGRGYLVGDIDILRVVGPASGYMAVLIFCLYISESASFAASLYPHRELLWGVCPVLLYWITRVWFLAERHVLTDDPLLFALRDRVSYLAGLLILGIVLLAKFATW